MTTIRDRKIWELSKPQFLRLACQPPPKSRQRLYNEICVYIEKYKRILLSQLRQELIDTLEIPQNIFERVDPVLVASKTHYTLIEEALAHGSKLPWCAVADYPELYRKYRKQVYSIPDQAFNEFDSWLINLQEQDEKIDKPWIGMESYYAAQ